MWKSFKEYIPVVWKGWWARVFSIVAAIGTGAQLSGYSIPHMPLWAWGIIAFVGIAIAQFLAFHKVASRLIPAEQMEATLKRLGKLRVDGVDMRNAGMKLKTKDEVDNWIKEINVWQGKVISEIVELSPAEAEIFRVVDIITTKRFRNAVNDDHQKYLRVVSDRTENIKKLVQRFTSESLTNRSRDEK